MKEFKGYHGANQAVPSIDPELLDDSNAKLVEAGYGEKSDDAYRDNEEMASDRNRADDAARRASPEERKAKKKATQGVQKSGTGDLPGRDSTGAVVGGKPMLQQGKADTSIVGRNQALIDANPAARKNWSKGKKSRERALKSMALAQPHRKKSSKKK